jgi:hypothetical protein
MHITCAGDDLGTVAFGLRQQFSSHLQHLGSMVLTVPSVLEMTWELLPSALHQFSSHLQHLWSIVLTVP